MYIHRCMVYVSVQLSAPVSISSRLYLPWFYRWDGSQLSWSSY